MDTGPHSEKKTIFKEAGRAWLSRCPCLSDNNNDTMCLFGRGPNYSYWLQGLSAESWILILWIYHTHRRILAFQTSSIRGGLPFLNDSIFLPWTELPSTSFKMAICENSVWEHRTVGSAGGKAAVNMSGVQTSWWYLFGSQEGRTGIW